MAYRRWEDRANYQHERYLRDKEGHKARALASRTRRNARIRALTREAKDRPCADCGVKYPFYVMQFDHLGDKAFAIGGIGAAVTRAKLREEIAKCEVVCANCHAERTYQRRLVDGFPTPLPVPEKEPEPPEHPTLF